jgi:hypothetical protein
VPGVSTIRTANRFSIEIWTRYIDCGNSAYQTVNPIDLISRLALPASCSPCQSPTRKQWPYGWPWGRGHWSRIWNRETQGFQRTITDTSAAQRMKLWLTATRNGLSTSSTRSPKGFLKGISGFFLWLRAPSSRWVRVPFGLLLIIGGIFGFLRVIGFWMAPLGALLIAQDVPFLRRPTLRALGWLEHKWKEWR